MNHIIGTNSPVMTNAVSGRMGAVPQPVLQRMAMEQQYPDMMRQQQPPQSDPYTQYREVLKSCTDVTCEKIMQDGRHAAAYDECETEIKRYLYEQCIPHVLDSPKGRTLFEQLYAVTRNLRDEYVQAEKQLEQQRRERDALFDRALKDEFIQERIREIQHEDAQKGGTA